MFDIARQDESPYIVSELLEGETLRNRLHSGALPVKKVIDYALQILRGLAAAHDRGILHRDLKPENIFVTRAGQIKILDFGLAKLTMPEPEGIDNLSAKPTMEAATCRGVLLGTMGYMSPEQLRGQPGDARSDLFSFGVVLYEMLSGRRPFHGKTTADTISAVLREDPPELMATGRDVPPDSWSASCGTAWRKIRQRAFNPLATWSSAWSRCPFYLLLHLLHRLRSQVPEVAKRG